MLADAAILSCTSTNGGEGPESTHVGRPGRRRARCHDGRHLAVRKPLIPQVREVLKAFFQAAFGTDAEGISMLFFLWYMATAGDETHPGDVRTRLGHAEAARTRGSSAAPA